jgi:hypothetical protein
VLSRGANQQASMRSGAEASRRATAGPRRALRRNRRTNRDGPAFLHKPGRSCVVSPRRRPSRWRLSPRSPGRRPPAFHLIPRSSGTSLLDETVLGTCTSCSSARRTQLGNAFARHRTSTPTSPQTEPGAICATALCSVAARARSVRREALPADLPDALCEPARFVGRARRRGDVGRHRCRAQALRSSRSPDANARGRPEGSPEHTNLAMLQDATSATAF